jgi:hypothetical protein
MFCERKWLVRKVLAFDSSCRNFLFINHVFEMDFSMMNLLGFFFGEILW